MRGLLAALVLVGACGTATEPTTTSTTAESTTTASTSTTTTASTTTTVAPTTSAGGSGMAQVVASRYGLMGWWSEGWVIPEDLAEIPLEGGEEYQVVMLDQPLTTAVGSAPTLCEPSQTPVLEFDPPLPGEFREPGALAVIADWELRPSPVRVEEALDPIHLAAMTEVLESLGVQGEPAIFQIVVADIDGDGVDEIVVVAKRVADNLFAQAGDYSVVVLRKMVEGEWQTAILESSVAEPESPYILSHSVAAIADLNGDGKMEIAVDAAYYEGSGTAAYEYIDDDRGPEVVLSGGCGA